MVNLNSYRVPKVGFPDLTCGLEAVPTLVRKRLILSAVESAGWFIR